MNDDIIRMARDAGSIDSEDVIEAVYFAFAAHEREACLLAVQNEGLIDPPVTESDIGYNAAIGDCAAAIRARGAE